MVLKSSHTRLTSSGISHSSSNYNDCRGLVILHYAPKDSHRVVFRVDFTKRNTSFIEEPNCGLLDIKKKNDYVTLIFQNLLST